LVKFKELKEKIVFEDPPDETIKNEDKQLISLTLKPENDFIIKKIIDYNDDHLNKYFEENKKRNE
jgi:hypothetical protein